MTELHGKGLVCDRCRRTAAHDPKQLGLEIGRGEVVDWPAYVSPLATRAALQAEGFDLIDDPKAKLVEQIKALLVNEVHDAHKRPEHQNVSDFLSQKLGYDYSCQSQLFSAQVGTTIERFLIAQKVERAKELLQHAGQSIAETGFWTGVQQRTSVHQPVSEHCGQHARSVPEATHRSANAGCGLSKPK